ncbi:GNAT family N-acetyltransferase [Caproiciproducens sp. MSJ-32]|uniref:GNAT family N-acetyltransferase n=1 Tax=Caproiciproducens sp. MSJ-32 TaxID=2841527 RepID=UPI001C0FB2BF|nr:GNAT family N-acetyltransferase [Caproiciproducens sp. MSJ-32]MBU5454117.1 GNAT family N-acetyltransferase [Caproiciproducens sp. MSJ-32]
MVGFDVRAIKKGDYNYIIKLNPDIAYLEEELVGDNKTIVAQLNDDVIGYLKYYIDGNNRAKIIDLVVDEMYRGLGVGYQLFLELEGRIKNEYVNDVLVAGRNFTKEELNFYNRQGFRYDINSNLEKRLN